MCRELAQIRLANPGDLDTIVACARSAYAMYIERMGREPAPMSMEYAPHIQQQHVYVLCEGDILYGSIVLLPGADYLLLDTLAVAPRYQGRGFGQQLLDFAEAHARAQQIQMLRLYTNEHMTENIAYYQKRGYRETKRASEAGYRRVYMQKMLT